MTRYIFYGATIALALGAPARAAEITTMGKIAPIVNISGKIELSDFEQFTRVAGPLTGNQIITLNSHGGNLIAALKIGEFIRLKSWSTYVMVECDSACAVIWLAGVPRSMTSDAKIGFHAASLNGVEKGVGNAFYGAYMSKLGLSYEAIGWATSAGPTEISYLTPDLAKKLGIDVDLVVVPARVSVASLLPLLETPAPTASPGLRDCSAFRFDLPQFFPAMFTDCASNRRPSADDHILDAVCAPPCSTKKGFDTIKTWDTYNPSTQRYTRRVLQTCRYCNGTYRLIATDYGPGETAATGGGSICFFNRTKSACASSDGNHYQLGQGSIKAFLAIEAAANRNVSICERPGATCE